MCGTAYYNCYSSERDNKKQHSNKAQIFYHAYKHVYPLLIFTKNMIYYAVSQQITVNPLSVVLSSVIATILFLIITFFETFTVSKLITKEKVNH